MGIHQKELSERPKKIVAVHHGAVLGGAPKSLAGILRELSKSDEFEFLVLCPYPEMSAYLEEHSGVKTAPICDLSKTFGKYLIGALALYNPATLKAFVKEIVCIPTTMRQQMQILRRNAPDIVHLNSSILFITALAARRLGIPIVWHVRENITGRRFDPRSFLARLLIRTLADEVIAISPVEAKKLGSFGRAVPAVIYNFVDFSIYNPSRYNVEEERRKLGIPRDAKVILSLGGATNFRKGPVHLIEAMNFFDERVHLVIAGQSVPVQKQRLATRSFDRLALTIEDLLLAGRVLETQKWRYEHRVRETYERVVKFIGASRIHCTGEMSEVAPVVAAADILLFTGTTPHFPRPIYEAWTMKKPVVAFDIDGVRQQVEHGVDGLLVSERSGRALADAVNRLLEAPEEMRRMGEAGYQKASKRFRMDVNSAKIADVYREVLRRGAGNES